MAISRAKARQIAKTITNQQIQEMFDKAKNSITDWTKVSDVNSGITKGVSWNILASDFDVNQQYIEISKINMIREFGDYLPFNIKNTVKKPKEVISKIVHQDPKF